MAGNEAKAGEIILVPTSHVARQSLDSVRRAIESERPDCIAVELDAGRYRSLLMRGERNTLGMIKAMGPSTFALYWTLKKLQDYLGGKTGILPGSEMLGALEAAKAKGIDAALIDQPIEITFYRIKKLPAGEKLGLLRLLLLAVVGMAVPFGRKEKIDLNRLPPEKLIREAMAYLEDELPSFYRVLVSERNEFMFRNLCELRRRYAKIVCVVGAAHESGLKKLLNK